jgi:hypothetical protein
MTLPTFFIIGAGKAGTTSLHYYLDLHPEIQMSAIKEPNFFLDRESDKTYPVGTITSLDEYERLFDPASAVRGEASPSYTSHPIRPRVPERIKALVPNARFIYLVRDPVARTISHHQHLVAIGKERRPLHEALRDLSDPFALPETCYSLYAWQIEQYLRLFPPDRMLVVDSAAFLTDRRGTLKRIFAFLSVYDGFESPQFDHLFYRSSERRVYPPGYDQFVGRVVAPAIQWIPRGIRRSIRSGVERALFRPLQEPALDTDLRIRLEALYAEDVARLRALTGMSFATWSV